MFPQSLLEMTNLRLWRQRFFNVNRVLKLSCSGYVVLIVLLLAIFLTVGFSVKEDISMTIEQFSISAIHGEEMTAYPFSFEGVVPYDLKDVYEPEDIRLAKLYITPLEVKHVGQRKMLVHLNDVRILKASEFIFAQPQRPAARERRFLVPMRMGMLKASMSRMSVDQVDIAAILGDMERRGVTNGIEKVKIILGEMTLIEFWLKKMFSKSPLFKEMSPFVD